MMPAWGLAVLPLVFLAVTWAWSGDWLLDRPAPGRWVRLGLSLAVVLMTVFGGYTGWRAWSVPDVGPIPMPSDWVAASSRLPDDLNAAPLYREAARRLNLNRPQRASWAEASDAASPPDLKEHPEAFDLIRRAAARPECQFADPGRMTLLTRLDLPPMRDLAEAVLAHARGRLHAGDLAAAWDDLIIAFRMARHVDQGATMIQALTSMAIERQALELAREWANAPGQSPDRLRAAMAAYRGLPAMTPPAEVIRAEGLLVERSLDLPVDDLRDWMAEAYGGNRAASTWELLRLDLIATPWERARARRVNRELTAEAAQLAALEPWRRPMGPGVPRDRRADPRTGEILPGGVVPAELLVLHDGGGPHRGRAPGPGVRDGRARVAAPPRRAVPRPAPGAGPRGVARPADGPAFGPAVPPHDLRPGVGPVPDGRLAAAPVAARHPADLQRRTQRPRRPRPARAGQQGE